jgi:hypothetical protein
MIITKLFENLLGRNRRESSESNPLAEYFFEHRGRLMTKWQHYFEIYHRHFERFRGAAPVVVEIGVFHGGSLQMWHDYFGRGARIIGVDINPACLKFENDMTTILIGDQGDRNFLAEVRERVPHIDILIDDGGHKMHQQIATFDELYPHIQPNGIYLCEDIHTSVLSGWGGGNGSNVTFLDYSKALVDKLYGWYVGNKVQECADPMTRSMFGLHFYDSVLVIEKRPMQPPKRCAAGIPSF